MNKEVFESTVREVAEDLISILYSKNESYGGSAVKPKGIFSKASTKERLLVRIDDKIKRIETLGPVGYGEDNMKDLANYLILYLVVDLHEKRKD